MTVTEMKKQIEQMDVKSDEFFELYSHIANKYYKIEDPDTYQQALMMVHGWLDRSCTNWEDQVIVVANVVKQVFEMRDKGLKACTGTLGFTNDTFHFDIYTSEVEKDSMTAMMMKAHDAMKKGEVKTKYGKNYFSKKAR